MSDTLATADHSASDRLPHCACGAPATAFRPGTEPWREGMSETRDILLDAGEPSSAWCFQCWGWRFAEMPLLAGARI